MYTTMISKLGVHVTNITRPTQRGAEMAARKAIKAGHGDSAAIFAPTGDNPVKYLGSGR